MMRLIQFVTDDGSRRVGRALDAERVAVVKNADSVYALAMDAIAKGRDLRSAVDDAGETDVVSYGDIVVEKRLLPPLDHPDPAHMLVSGTGLTHLGSADTRDSMHKQAMEGEESELTDSMRMFRDGLAGGKPALGQVGAQPEWFYKGDGSIVVAPEAPIPSPPFAEGGGEESEIVGLYVIAPEGIPFRLGFALGNEFSDHVLERRNYLLLAHSKLRACSFGPELLVGELPNDVRGTSRVRRNGTVLWEKPFWSGEANMSHSISNLEHHHFKYAQHSRPGQAHVHYFGAANLSFADGICAEAGDVFEIDVALFGRSLRNPLSIEQSLQSPVRTRSL